MVAIKITQQDKDNNVELLKFKKVSDIVKFSKLPKIWNGIEDFDIIHKEDYNSFRFYDVIYDKLEANQSYYNLKDSDFNNNVWTIRINENLQDKEHINKIRKQERNKKLTDGIIVNNIWFNEDKLTQFTVMAQMVQSMGQTSFEWGFEDNTFKPITVQDAFNTVMQASAQFQQIYKDY